MDLPQCPVFSGPNDGWEHRTEPEPLAGTRPDSPVSSASSDGRSGESSDGIRRRRSLASLDSTQAPLPPRHTEPNTAVFQSVHCPVRCQCPASVRRIERRVQSSLNPGEQFFPAFSNPSVVTSGAPGCPEFSQKLHPPLWILQY